MKVFALEIPMPRPSRDYEQISLRIPTAWLKDAEEIAKLISRPGIEATRADALRHAIARGFEVLKAEAKAAKKK